MSAAAERRLAAVPLPVSPESELRELFAREAANTREALAIHTSIIRARRAFATKHGLITPPRVERLRQEFGK